MNRLWTPIKRERRVRERVVDPRRDGAGEEVVELRRIPPDHVEGRLHHVLGAGAGGLERPRHVPQGLLGLGGQALGDGAVLVLAHLPGDVHDQVAAGGGGVAVPLGGPNPGMLCSVTVIVLLRAGISVGVGPSMFHRPPSAELRRPARQAPGDAQSLASAAGRATYPAVVSIQRSVTPMRLANTSVPMPTWPPMTKPTATLVSSIPVRTGASG